MPESKLKYIFIVQGEGRGHLTQAIAFSEILDDAGYECIKVFTGISRFRKLPEFYLSKFKKKLFLYKSPNFILDRKNKEYRVFASVLMNLILFPVFINSILRIRKNLLKLNPDLIINFYEPLSGPLRFLSGKKIPLISVAHQFYYKHPDFKKEGLKINFLLKLLNHAAGFGSDKLFAIHFEEKESVGKMIVIPPLIRKDIQSMKPTRGNYYTAYTLNHGYSHDVMHWHKSNPTVNIEFFWDNKECPETYIYDDHLVFFPVNDKNFIRSLSSSAGLIVSAGYESICEALFLGKPVIMIPILNHSEQKINALLFSSIDGTMISQSFNPSYFLNLELNGETNDRFREWVGKAGNRITTEIEKLLNIK